MHTHTHTHRHTHPHEYTGYTIFNLHTTYTDNKQRLAVGKTPLQNRSIALPLGKKKKVLGLELKKSREGFCQRGRGSHSM